MILRALLHALGTRADFVVEPLPRRGLSVRAVRGTAPDDVWVLGVDAGGRSRCFRFDGRAWRDVEAPDGLTAIAPVARDEVWAVGRHGLAARFDGRAWREARIDVAWDLVDVAAGGGRAWAVAGGSEIHRHDGRRWELVVVDELARLRVRRVFAVGGQVIVPATRLPEAAIVRHDGAAWRREPVGEGLVTRVAGAGPDDLWAFAPTAEAFHLEAGVWRPAPRPSGDPLVDAWAASPRELWVAGANGMIQTWDGASWSTLRSGTCARLWTIWAAPGGTVYAGGEGGLRRLAGYR